MEDALTLEPLDGPPVARFVARRGGAVKLGRGLECPLFLDHPTVSRNHGLLSEKGGHWFYTDLGSQAGSMLNGARLAARTPVSLGEGDLLRVGPFVFRVRTRAEQATVVRTLDDGAPAPRVAPKAPAAGGAAERLRLLLRCAEEIGAAPSEEELAGVIAACALAGAGGARAAVLARLGDDKEVAIVASRTRAGLSPEFAVGRSLVRSASAGEAAFVGGEGQGDWGQSIVELGIRSALCVPVHEGDAVTAFLYVDSRASEPPIAAEALEFCSALALLHGLALARLRRTETERRHRDLLAELRAAREAQELLGPPSSGRIHGLRYEMRMRPGLVVAGDMFDALALPGGRVAICLGDVTGAGAGAGIVMAAAQSHLHGALLQSPDPAQALGAVNRYLATHSAKGRFVSLWVGVVDPTGRRVVYSDAGHGHWLKVRADGDAERPESKGGIPAGILAETVYRSALLDLGPGERLLLFSDGIVEQPSIHGERFGLDRVREVVRNSRSAADDVAHLFDSLLRFAGTDSLDDDTTIASLEVPLS